MKKPFKLSKMMVKRDLGFQVPAGYFSNLFNRILRKVNSGGNKSPTEHRKPQITKSYQRNFGLKNITKNGQDK